MDTDRNLLFGVIALQADLIDPQQFIDACLLWSSRKDVPLAEVLIERHLVRVDVPAGTGFGPDLRQRVSRLPQRVERVRDLPALAVGPARRVGDEPVSHLPGFQGDLLDRFPGH